MATKEYNFKYNQKPEVKAYRKRYNQHPRIKAWRKGYNHNYYQRPEVKIRLAASWRIAERKERARLKRIDDKKKCIAVYSNGTMACACCGEKHMAFLTLDHVNNNGEKHRRKTASGGTSFYCGLVKRSFPDKKLLRVLCWNCNCGRQLNGGICPHEGHGVGGHGRKG